MGSLNEPLANSNSSTICKYEEYAFKDYTVRLSKSVLGLFFPNKFSFYFFSSEKPGELGKLITKRGNNSCLIGQLWFIMLRSEVVDRKRLLNCLTTYAEIEHGYKEILQNLINQIK